MGGGGTNEETKKGNTVDCFFRKENYSSKYCHTMLTYFGCKTSLPNSFFFLFFLIKQVYLILNS